MLKGATSRFDACSADGSAAPVPTRFHLCAEPSLHSRSDSPGRGGLQDAAEGGAFHVARRAAGSGVPQTLAHGAQLADRPVQLIRLRRELPPVDARPPVRREHVRNLIERKAGGAPQGDQRQPFQDAGIEPTTQAPPPGGRDQPLVLVKPQRRDGHAGTLRHLTDVQIARHLDLKST
jgi:hypothetical protein